MYTHTQETTLHVKLTGFLDVFIFLLKVPSLASKRISAYFNGRHSGFCTGSSHGGYRVKVRSQDIVANLTELQAADRDARQTAL